MRELPDELRDNWAKAYQFLCVRFPSATEYTTMERFQNQAGITDRLIVHLIEEAIKRQRRNFIAWTAQVLSECAANGITTVDQWKAFDAMRDQQQKARPGQTSSSSRQPRAFASLQRAMEKAQEEGE